MTILVTGCAGLIGNHFSRHLLNKGHEVVGIDDLSGGFKENIHPNVKLVVSNLCDNKTLDAIFTSFKPEFVYHFAAYAAVGLSPFIRNFNYTNNVVSSINVINACVNHNVKKMIFASSMDVYGDAYMPPYNESMMPMPIDPYGIAKFSVEMDLKAAGKFFDLHYSIVRPHNVLGVYQNIWDKYRNVLGIWIRQTLSAQPMTIYGDGSQIRSFSDVRFYMDPFEKLMTVGDGETYNIGADKHMTILEAAHRFQTVARKRGHNALIQHVHAREEVQSAYCSHAKAKAQLDFKDETNFDNLIDEMLSWAEKEPQRPVKIMSYEIEKKMYDFWRS